LEYSINSLRPLPLWGALGLRLDLLNSNSCSPEVENTSFTKEFPVAWKLTAKEPNTKLVTKSEMVVRIVDVYF
jgi:hypothetical protein